MSKKTKLVKKLDLQTELLAQLTPEELEPRLELQVLIDPMAVMLDANNNNNNNNNNNEDPWF